MPWTIAVAFLLLCVFGWATSYTLDGYIPVVALLAVAVLLAPILRASRAPAAARK